MKSIRVNRFILNADNIVYCEFRSKTEDAPHSIKVSFVNRCDITFYDKDVDEFVRQLDGMPK